MIHTVLFCVRHRTYLHDDLQVHDHRKYVGCDDVLVERKIDTPVNPDKPHRRRKR